MRAVFCRLIALALLAAPACAATVAVTGGVIRGQELKDGSAVYRAIPYAAPPLGELRWKPPAPVIAWQGVRDAVNAPHPCMQGWGAVTPSRTPCHATTGAGGFQRNSPSGGAAYGMAR